MAEEYEDNDMQDVLDLTPKENIRIMRWLVKEWNLGPKVGIDNNQGNAAYWNNMSKVWGITPKEARRRSCANCEYGKLEPDDLKAMEHIPYNSYDKDGGMRVWCEKFDFICHATRVCQNWED